MLWQPIERILWAEIRKLTWLAVSIVPLAFEFFFLSSSTAGESISSVASIAFLSKVFSNSLSDQIGFYSKIKCHHKKNLREKKLKESRRTILVFFHCCSALCMRFFITNLVALSLRFLISSSMISSSCWRFGGTWLFSRRQLYCCNDFLALNNFDRCVSWVFFEMITNYSFANGPPVMVSRI